MDEQLGAPLETEQRTQETEKANTQLQSKVRDVKNRLQQTSSELREAREELVQARSDIVDLETQLGEVQRLQQATKEENQATELAAETALVKVLAQHKEQLMIAADKDSKMQEENIDLEGQLEAQRCSSPWAEEFLTEQAEKKVQDEMAELRSQVEDAKEQKQHFRKQLEDMKQMLAISAKGRAAAEQEAMATQGEMVQLISQHKANMEAAREKNQEEEEW